MFFLLRQLKQLFEARETLFFFTLKEIKIKYQKAALGFLWAIFAPVLYMLIISAVTSMIVRFDGVDNYPLFLLVGLLPWTFLQNCVMQASNSIRENDNLIRKVPFLRDIIPASKVLSNLLDFIVAFVLLLVYVAIFARPPLSPAPLLLPLVIVMQLAFVLGVTILLAALMAMFVDVRYAKDLLMLVWFYSSPVFYPDTVVPRHLHAVYYLNPLAGSIHIFRSLLLDGTYPDPWIALYTVVICFALLWLGYRVFRHYEPQIVDLL